MQRFHTFLPGFLQSDDRYCGFAFIPKIKRFIDHGGGVSVSTGSLFFSTITQQVMPGEQRTCRTVVKNTLAKLSWTNPKRPVDRIADRCGRYRISRIDVRNNFTRAISVVVKKKNCKTIEFHFSADKPNTISAIYSRRGSPQQVIRIRLALKIIYSAGSSALFAKTFYSGFCVSSSRISFVVYFDIIYDEPFGRIICIYLVRNKKNPTGGGGDQSRISLL